MLNLDRFLGLTAVTGCTIAFTAIFLVPTATAAFGETCWVGGVPTSHGACAQNHCEEEEDGQRCNDGSFITGPDECDCPPVPPEA